MQRPRVIEAGPDESGQVLEIVLVALDHEPSGELVLYGGHEKPAAGPIRDAAQPEHHPGELPDIGGGQQGCLGGPSLHTRYRAQPGAQLWPVTADDLDRDHPCDPALRCPVRDHHQADDCAIVLVDQACAAESGLDADAGRGHRIQLDPLPSRAAHPGKRRTGPGALVMAGRMPEHPERLPGGAAGVSERGRVCASYLVTEHFQQGEVAR